MTPLPALLPLFESRAATDTRLDDSSRPERRGRRGRCEAVGTSQRSPKAPGWRPAPIFVLLARTSSVWQPTRPSATPAGSGRPRPRLAREPERLPLNDAVGFDDDEARPLGAVEDRRAAFDPRLSRAATAWRSAGVRSSIHSSVFRDRVSRGARWATYQMSGC